MIKANKSFYLGKIQVMIMRPTMKDIAQKTGLSVTTVSLALNNKPSNIPPRTRELVLNAARELGYRPNKLAAGLRGKCTNTLGLILPDIRNVFFSSLCKGVEDACREMGWNVILCNTSDSHRRDMEYIQILADRSVDGILYCISSDSTLLQAQESCKLLGSLSMPFVLLDRDADIAGCDLVLTDHRQGGFLGARHLLSLGHRHIALVTGPSHLNGCKQRLDGVKRAYEDAGIVFDPALVYEGNFRLESGEASVDFLLNKKISAVFAFNDMMAYGIYKGLRRRGLRVPRDLSVIGYDDVFPSDIVGVPLTSVRQPVYEMGKAGARRMISRIQQPQILCETKRLSPVLVLRESTVPFK